MSWSAMVTLAEESSLDMSPMFRQLSPETRINLIRILRRGQLSAHSNSVLPLLSFRLTSAPLFRSISTSSRFQLQHEDDEPELLEVPDQVEELDKAKEMVKKLVFSVRKLTKRRQKETSVLKKVEWALYAREDFNKLVNDISYLVEKLVALFPVIQPAQEVLCRGEASQIDPEVIPTLVAVLGDKDKLLNHALAEEVKVKGHRLQGATIRQGGLTTIGDSFKNVFDTLAPGADVSNVDISGSLKVGHQYEISDAVALAKLGHAPNPQGQQ